VWTKEQILAVASSKKVLIPTVSLLSATIGAAVGYRVALSKLEAHYNEVVQREISETRLFYKHLAKTTLPQKQYSDPSKAVEALVGDREEKIVEAADALLTYQGDPPDESEQSDAVEESGEPEEDSSEENEIALRVFTSDSEEGFDYEEEIAKRTPEVPYIITQVEFFNNELGYEQATLTYFEGDDVLVDGKDEVVDDREITVGDDNLSRFGHGAADHDMVYIRSEQLSMEFEIIRDHGSYTKQVLGFLEHADRRKVPKFRPRDE
jgi:hypothetical protein